MDIYDALGVTKIINGAATLTRYGGSLMPAVVLEAMAEAAHHFVDIDELQQKGRGTDRRVDAQRSGLRLLWLRCGACLEHGGLHHGSRSRKTRPSALHRRLAQRGHRPQARPCRLRLRHPAGGRQAGGDRRRRTARPRSELERAINEKTAAIFYFYNVSRMDGQVPLDAGIAIAQAHNIPLIVDAAAQIPPVSNLWRFTEMGADLGAL